LEIIKTSLTFRDGEIFETEKYSPGVSDEATTLERIKCFLTDFIFRNKLTGNISVEINKKKVYVDYSIKPAKWKKELHRKLVARYHVSDRDKL